RPQKSMASIVGGGAPGYSDDISIRINARGVGAREARRKGGMQVHQAARGAAPQQCMGRPPRTTVPHLLPSEGGISERAVEPAWLEVHHATGAASPQHRVDADPNLLLA